MAAGLTAIGRRDRSDEPVALTAADGVDVTKRQRKVQRQRDQREPRTKSDMVTNQTHPMQTVKRSYPASRSGQWKVRKGLV